MKTQLVLFVIAIFSIYSCKNNSSQSSSTVLDGSLKDCDISGHAEHSTNTDILKLKEQMVAFRASLNEPLLNQASNCLENERFYLWHNTPANKRGKRHGITYGDLSEEQLNQFKGLMQLFLSADGYQKVNEITVLSEGWLNEIKSDIWNPMFYSIDLFGDPNKSGSWGFQLDGHHCVVNFLVNGDNVSIVPAFLGGEPAKETFNGKAFDIFKDERDLALKLYNGLTSEEQKAAVSNSSERSLQVGPADRPGQPDPYIGDYDYSPFETGLKYTQMSERTRENLVVLMKEYVYNLNHSFADVWWNDITENLDQTYLVWIDDVDTPNITSQFYYRIYNPYLWAEFNTENITGANQNNIDNWNHIHTITRIPNNPKNGGDNGVYASIINQNGPSTLYEHYISADHHHKSDIHIDYEVHSHRHHNNSHTH